MAKFEVRREANIIQGHVLDCARPALLAALRRYDPLLYLRWNPKKRAGRGIWELRRKPEFKSVKEGRMMESPKGKVFIPGDVYEFDTFTISVPKYNENSFNNHVKDFEYLTYEMVDWVAKHDLWNYGFKGKNTMSEAEYREAKWLEKIDEDSDAEKQYMIRQYRTQINDYRQYILSGGNPADIVDYWGKV